MLTRATTEQSLLAENAELRARLDEAEQTLRAIRAGDVDALVVDGDAGPRLYTLQGSDAAQNRFRGDMLAQVSDAVVAVDVLDRVTFFNAAAEGQYGVRAGDVLGLKRAQIYTNRWPSPEAKAKKDVAQCEHGEWRGELIHRCAHGREFPVEVSLTVLRGPDGECTGRVATIRDITLRKEAEAALRRNAALFSEIIEQAPGGVYVVDAQFRVAQMNAESLPFFASAQPLIGRDFEEVLEILWGPEIGPQLTSIFRHTLTTGEHYVSPRFSGKRNDIGMEQVFEWETKRITLPDGQHGVACYFQDVTARERAEAERRETEERLTLAVKSSKVMLFQQDSELRYQWIQNPVQGFESAEVIGKRDADLMERADEAALIEALKREVIRSGVGKQQEVLVHIQNAPRHFDLLLEPLRDAAGLISGVTCAAIEITERKHVEAALRDKERDYSALAEASSEIPYRMSADWSTMLPLDGRDLVASSDRPLVNWAWLHQKIPRDEHARVRQAISDAMDRRGLFELEHRVRRSDGSIGWIFSRAVPILDESADVIAWFGAASDITERKRIELNLTHAIAIAEKANRAKSDFLSSMSHELRTPLNAILGFAQLLESSAPALTPAQLRNLEQILKGGWYLLELINEILDLALIESGKLSLTQEPVSLAEVMRECRAMFEPQASKSGIGMTFPPLDVPGYVRADRTRIKQVLINLLSNAIKYNKPEGTVAVEWTLRPPDSICLSVRDTGAGLAPEQLAQLFQPFNRLGKEAGTTEGTGIGLVMTKRLVELMGGAIGVESVVGVGSVFWFELKLASAPQLAAQTPPRVPPRVPPGTPLRNVLYVEDNPANLALIEQIISRRPDLHLLSATDGNVGIEMTRAHQPQVILIDVNLSGINGIEVMRILRADPSTAHIPIVALSANALPGDIEDGIKAGFFSYLTKPIKVAQFMDALDVALDFSQSAPGQAARKEQAS